jgi:hypothetical protein
VLEVAGGVGHDGRVGAPEVVHHFLKMPKIIAKKTKKFIPKNPIFKYSFEYHHLVKYTVIIKLSIIQKHTKIYFRIPMYF